MSNYSVVTNWVGLDSLLDTDPNKVISGSTFETEFKTISDAINTKQDLLSVIDSGTLGTSTTAVPSQGAVKVYVDEVAEATRKYRGRREIILDTPTPNVDLVFDFSNMIEEGWDDFDELVFYISDDDSAKGIAAVKVDTQDIIDVVPLTTDGYYRVANFDYYWYIKYDSADTIQFVKAGPGSENSIIHRVIGVKYE